jgi:hypothetical protein
MAKDKQNKPENDENDDDCFSEDEMIDEIICEFRYSIDGLGREDDDEVEEIISNLIDETLEDDNSELAEEIQQILWEEWQCFLEEQDDEFDLFDEDED